MKNQLETIKNKKRNGFTLVELIVVMAIIGILAAIAIPNYTQYVQKAKNTSIESDGATIQQAALTAIIEDISKKEGKSTDATINAAVNTILSPGITIKADATAADAYSWTVTYTHSSGTGSGTITAITVNGPTKLTYTGGADPTAPYSVTRTIK